MIFSVWLKHGRRATRLEFFSLYLSCQVAKALGASQKNASKEKVLVIPRRLEFQSNITFRQDTLSYSINFYGLWQTEMFN